MQKKNIQNPENSQGCLKPLLPTGASFTPNFTSFDTKEDKGAVDTWVRRDDFVSILKIHESVARLLG